MNYMQKNMIYYINKGELDIQKIRVEYWNQSVLNPGPVNLWLKIKYNADFFFLPKLCKSLKSPVGTANHFFVFSVSSSYVGFSLQK